MTTQNARVHISLSNGTVEIEGTETFVVAQIDRFEPYIKRAFESIKKAPSKSSEGVSDIGKESNSTSPETGYPNLFAFADQKVQILKNIPGDGKRQKMVNVALLLTYANSLVGIEATTYDAIRDVCSAHACLDGPNFSKTLKNEKEFFIIGGTPKRQTVTLSVPGKKKVQELAEKLNSE